MRLGEIPRRRRARGDRCGDDREWNLRRGDSRRSAEQRALPGPYVRVDGREIAYRHWGTHGSPVVLIGGFIEATDVWRLVAPLLAKTHRVYALDLPPFGYSERKGPYPSSRRGSTRSRASNTHYTSCDRHSSATPSSRRRRRRGVAPPGRTTGHRAPRRRCSARRHSARLASLAHRQSVLHRSLSHRHRLGLDLPQGLEAGVRASAPSITDADVNRWQRPFRSPERRGRSSR